jgi:hypothetical protein
LQESATSLDEIVVFSNNLKRIQQIGASTKNCGRQIKTTLRR